MFAYKCLHNDEYVLYTPTKTEESMLSVSPTSAQLNWQEMDYYAFIHYSINTFNVPAVMRNFISGIEWSNGSIPAKNFNPKHQDTDQWCKVIKEAGMKGVIVTAKHHDGFVLFDSKYEYNRPNKRGLTRYSIKDSPYKKGKGDIVAEVAQSCKKYGLKLGIYYSPWDRSHPEYGQDNPNPKIYNDYMINQVEELCTNYGEVFEVWLDTAIGEESAGKPHKYEWDRLLSTIKKCQPDCMIAFGNDFRYIGNEWGYTRRYEWSVADVTTPVINEKGEINIKDNNLRWYPVEVNVPNHSGWYYHSNDRFAPYKYTDNKWYGWCSPMRTPKLLFDIYLRTVGHNANFLLNVPPTYDGVIHKKDIEQLMELKKKIDSIYSYPITSGTVTAKGAKDIENAFENSGNALLNASGAEIEIKFETQNLGYLILEEDIRYSQRVKEFKVYVERDGEYHIWLEKTTIGKREICDMQGIHTGKIKIVFTQSIGNIYLKSVRLFEKSN